MVESEGTFSLSASSLPADIAYDSALYTFYDLQASHLTRIQSLTQSEAVRHRRTLYTFPCRKSPTQDSL